ncbi:MAG: ATP-binding protein [Bacteroidales bacterium]|nr:ATP-binding protein [Bacteroidales bacterium]MCF8456028.1 ATP-binding protein [Bacteroidales bacterium]
MKICSIHIKGFQQFNDTFLDFTNPETGEPAEKICFIGKNGTGKSTLLNLINECLPNIVNYSVSKIPFLLIKLKTPVGLINLLYTQVKGQVLVFTGDIDSNSVWQDMLKAPYDKRTIEYSLSILEKHKVSILENSELLKDIVFYSDSVDQFIYSPAESQNNNYYNVKDVPDTSLDNALGLSKEFPYHHIVSDEKVHEFWRTLIYHIKKRENEREEFENLPENINKTKRLLIEEFNDRSPKILDCIAQLWNKILDKAGLEFDIENARNPIQLTDNLKVYIRLKESKETIPYNQLSKGIRNFIFRMGHIYSLYFNREINKGFLLIDEPENSLFPDFLYDLVETYQELVIDRNDENNTQIFMATHNPIIAAQFEPYERIVLEWNEQGYVDAVKGTAPAGDDPNDLLIKDFKLKNVIGKKGQEMWEEYLFLRKTLRRTNKPHEKEKLISIINKIGLDYNFEDHEDS